MKDKGSGEDTKNAKGKKKKEKKTEAKK